MITHNGTYLLAATHHGMPIYAATMGGKMVYRQWLPYATLQAIVAAFGAEGTEVIAKTNDYLNRIATTDPQRALLLAGFINEDPMMVCSLGLEPTLTTLPSMPIRLCVSNNGGRINLGINPDNNTTVKMRIVCKQHDNSFNWNVVFGAGQSSNANNFGLFLSTYGGYSPHAYWYSCGGTDATTGVICTNNYTHSIEMSITQLIADGVVIKSQSGKSISTNNPLYLFEFINNHQPPFKGGFGYFEMIKSGTSVRELYPWKKNGEVGMIDVLTNTFYGKDNSGSLTMEYGYCENGSWVTWTPPTT